MNYRILQLKDIENCDYAFMSYEFAKNHNFHLTDYRVIYWGTDDSFRSRKDIEILENIFLSFNRVTDKDVERLEKINFFGHSLSVSDIVILENRIYYCDFSGWALIK